MAISSRPHFLTLLCLGFIVGIIAGYSAVAFRLMIGFFHHLFFFGQLHFFYDANVHTAASQWGWAVIFVPVLGSLGVTFIIKTFTPEAKGRGVAEVIDAIYYQQGNIRPVVALGKAIASALSIGTGGSAGREGPIIHIGATLGATVAQLINMPLRARIILIAAGAGGGIAATFNSPIGGMAFAIELLLVSVNALTLAVIAIATVTATYISRYYLGMHPAFDLPELAVPAGELTPVIQLLLFIPFAVFIGLIATLFIKSLYWFEDMFEKLPVNDYLRHASGMLLVGIIMYLLLRYAGHYYVQGVGYATIVDVLEGILADPGFLLLLCGLKLLATGLTLGSDASGGIFSPGLFMGATFGAATGNAILLCFPDLPISPAMFAVAGMAGMVSGTTGAVLTAITMLFEMTHDYNAILPIVLTATIAYMVRKYFSNANIYTEKLHRRGHIVPEGLQAAMSSAQQAKHLMCQDYLLVERDQLDTQREQIHKKRLEKKPVIVTDHQQCLGLFIEQYTKTGPKLAVNKQVIFVAEHDSLLDVLRQLGQSHCDTAFVMKDAKKRDAQHFVGVITPKEMTNFATHTSEFI